jgi:hypothetical protein
VTDGFETPLAATVTIFNGPWNTCVECVSDITPTPTPSSTPTLTPTATNTATPSVTPTSTLTPSVSASPTVTPSITPSVTTTSTTTPTNSPTPSITASPSATAPVTPTPTDTPSSTPTATPTPSVTIGLVIEVNQQYEYTIGMLGSFSGGTAPAGATVPYSVMTSEDGDEVIVQLNAISLGGFQGLNN